MSIAEELRLASRSYIAGRDNELELHLRRALAIVEGTRRGLL